MALNIGVKLKTTNFVVYQKEFYGPSHAIMTKTLHKTLKERECPGVMVVQVVAESMEWGI